MVSSNPKWARQDRNIRRRERERKWQERAKWVAAPPGTPLKPTPSETNQSELMMNLRKEIARQKLPSYENGCQKMAAVVERMDTTPLAPPDNYVAIVEDAVERFDPFSMPTPHLLYRLYSGVLLDNGNKMYWVDRVSNKNCFMLFPGSLEIKSVTAACKVSCKTRVGMIERAIIMDATQVEITGSLDTIGLSPNTVYVMAFVVRKHQRHSSAKLKLEITLPSGGEIKNNVIIPTESDKWIEILGSELLMSPENVGELKFVLKDNGGTLKLAGVEILGVCLRPKINARPITGDVYKHYVGSDAGIFPDESLGFLDSLLLCCFY